MLCFCFTAGEPVSAQTGSSEADRYYDRAQRLYEQSRYDSVPLYFERARALYRSAGDVSMEVRCVLGLSETYRIQHDYGQSEKLAGRAEGMLQELEAPDSMLYAELWYLKGKLCYDHGDYPTAIDQLNISLSLFERWALESFQLERVFNFLTKVYLTRGDLESARYYVSLLIDHIRTYGHSPSIEEAWYFSRMSSIMREMGDYQAVLANSLKSIRIQKRVFGKDFPDLEQSYRQMATNYNYIGEFDSASAYLDTAGMYIEKYFPDDRIRQVNLLLSRGNVEYSRGNYANAQDDYERGWNILSDGSNAPPRLAYLLMIGMGNAHYVQHEYRAALEYYLRLLDFSKDFHPSRMLVVHHRLAITYKNLREYDQAGKYYRMLFGELRKYYGEDNTVLAVYYIDYAIFLDETHRPDRSHLYLNKALGIRKKGLGEFHYQTADCYLRLGNFFREHARPDSALGYYQQALHSLARGYEPDRLLENPGHGEASHQRVFIEAMKGKAAMLEQLAGNRSDSLEWLRAALDCYEKIFPAIDRLRNESVSEEGRLFISENERDAYVNAVRLSLGLYQRTGNRADREAAFRMAEKAKYTTLLMAVRNNNAITFSGVPQDVQARLRSIRSRISAYMDMINETEGTEIHDSTRLAGLYTEYYGLKDEESTLITNLEKDYPEYYRLKYDNRVAQVGEIRKRLGRKERMIEYFLCDSSLVTFVLTRKEFFSVTRPVDSTFQKNIDLVKGFCSASFVSGHKKVSDSVFSRAAAELYDLLIRPCGLRKGERLTLIPDAGMNYLSFDVLLSQRVTDRRDYKDFPFLISDHPITYSYSSTLFLNHSRRHPTGQNRLLAMAPAYYGEKKNDFETVRAQEVRRDDLEPLLGGRDEIRGIQRIIGGDAVYGDSASEHLFKDEAPDYGILHLAMHAFMDDTDPLYSRLIFSENADSGEDGFLNAHEIYNMNLNAGMVVLSACHTGEGIVRKGEGIMSLARAFYYSGVPDVVMSLWTVSDTSGRNLMIDFYRELAKGFPKGKAMQRAKLEMLNVREPDRQEPYYWGAYIVTGDPAPLFYSTRKILVIAVLSLAIMSAVIFSWIRRRRRISAGGEEQS